MKTLGYSLLAGLGLALAGAAAQAQDSNQGQATAEARQSQPDAVSAMLAEWQSTDIYKLGAMRAEHLINGDVFGSKGNKIGSIEDAIVSAKGQIQALILEVGDHWGMPDTHVVVPWNEVKLTSRGVKVPVSEDTYQEYVLFSENSFITMDELQKTHPVDDILATGAQTWKLTALVDDYVVFQNGAAYGYLDDVIFTKDGKIVALIVDSTGTTYGYGTYAIPYFGPGYGWQPYDNVYTLPYGSEVVQAPQPFDYDLFDEIWR